MGLVTPLRTNPTLDCMSADRPSLNRDNHHIFCDRVLEQATKPPNLMMSTNNNRLKADSSATAKTSCSLGSVPVQAGPVRRCYWTKNFRKFRKFRKKKKATPQQDKERKKLEDFKVIQANVAGIGTKKKEYEKLMHDNQVHLALLQETIHRNTNIHITGYTAYACKCNNCRGIITYVRNDVTCEVKDLSSTSQPTDIHQITAWYGNNKLQFFNIYSPPGKPFNFPDTRVTFNKTILTGDFNGHSPLWGYEDTNDTGRRIEARILFCYKTRIHPKPSFIKCMALFIAQI